MYSCKRTKITNIPVTDDGTIFEGDSLVLDGETIGLNGSKLIF